MNDVELIGVVIGFGTLSVSCIALFLDSRKRFAEFEIDRENVRKERELIQKERESIQRDRLTIEELKKVSKALMDIVTGQRDEIRVLQSQIARHASASEQHLQIARNQQSWQILKDILGGAAWVLDRIEDE
jgi:predicted RNase H-like nuclease (RuvC/YqgF family)